MVLLCKKICLPTLSIVVLPIMIHSWYYSRSAWIAWRASAMHVPKGGYKLRRADIFLFTTPYPFLSTPPLAPRTNYMLESSFNRRDVDDLQQNKKRNNNRIVLKHTNNIRYSRPDLQYITLSADWQAKRRNSRRKEVADFSGPLVLEY